MSSSWAIVLWAPYYLGIQWIWSKIKRFLKGWTAFDMAAGQCDSKKFWQLWWKTSCWTVYILDRLRLLRPIISPLYLSLWHLWSPDTAVHHLSRGLCYLSVPSSYTPPISSSTLLFTSHYLSDGYSGEAEHVQSPQVSPADASFFLTVSLLSAPTSFGTGKADVGHVPIVFLLPPFLSFPLGNYRPAIWWIESDVV